MLRLDAISLVWAFFRPEEKEDYMEVRKEDQSVIITFLEKNQQFQKSRPGDFGCDTAEV